MVSLEYPKEKSKAEVLSGLYQELQGKDIDIRLDVAVAGDKHLRVDAVVFNQGIAVCIIECKGDLIHSLSSQKKRRLASQIKKYKDSLGIPVIVCGNSQIDALRTMAAVEKLLQG